MPDHVIGLSRLNETERQILLMLADGHTVKSIASELDITPAAINERLREARRKTGLGSSREVARLLKSQENRHEQIGVAPAVMPGANHPRQDAGSWRSQTGVFAMIALLLAAAAGAAILSQSPAATNEVDPLIGAALPAGPDLASLHARVRTEQRDAAWAPAIESKVRARVRQIPLIGTNGNELRVLCASTLCEISGSLVVPSKAEVEDQHSRFSRTISELQLPPFPDDLAKLGLKMETGLFTGRQGKPDRSVFLLYYSRVK